MNFSPDISLIIECCKTTLNAALVQELSGRISDWAAFEELSYAHGVFPLVYGVLKLHGANVPNAVIQSMKSHNMAIAKQNMLMSTELIKVMKLLEANAIEAIAFKGPALAQQAYGNITLRQYVDLDILVDEKNLILAQLVLEENNYKEEYNLEEYQKENLKTVVHDRSFIHQINNIHIELHWTLSSGEFFIDLEKLDYFKNATKFEINKYMLHTLSDEINFIYLCVHGYKHLWERIEWLVDISYLIEKKNLNFEKIFAMSAEVNAQKILLSSIYICNILFEVKIPSIISNEIKNDVKLRATTEKMIRNISQNYDNTNQEVHSKHISLVQFYMLNGYVNKIKYIKTLFLPTEEDYKTVKLPVYLSFLYVIIRPFNILVRKFYT